MLLDRNVYFSFTFSELTDEEIVFNKARKGHYKTRTEKKTESNKYVFRLLCLRVK